MGPRRLRRGNARMALHNAAESTASMGPRRLRRGNDIQDNRKVTISGSFNGAAPVKARKRLRRSHSRADTMLLQWGRAG